MNNFYRKCALFFVNKLEYRAIANRKIKAKLFTILTGLEQAK